MLLLIGDGNLSYFTLTHISNSTIVRSRIYFFLPVISYIFHRSSRIFNRARHCLRKKSAGINSKTAWRCGLHLVRTEKIPIVLQARSQRVAVFSSFGDRRVVRMRKFRLRNKTTIFHRAHHFDGSEQSGSEKGDRSNNEDRKNRASRNRNQGCLQVSMTSGQSV